MTIIYDDDVEHAVVFLCSDGFALAHVLGPDGNRTEKAVVLRASTAADLIQFDVIMWHTPAVSNQISNLPVGSEVVIKLSWRGLVDRWALAADYDEIRVAMTTEYFRILEDGAVIWSGHYSPDRQSPLVTEEGRLPSELNNLMVVQRDYLDDAQDDGYGGGFVIPGGWDDCDKQEQTWVDLFAASQRH